MTSRELTSAVSGAVQPPVFVFGSNLAGRHGRGAALWARQHRGAVYGQGVGYQGNSYAIPTKTASLSVMHLNAIHGHVRDFLRFAQSRPDLEFELTPIGCGLAGYSRAVIAPMFRDTPANVLLPPEFVAALANADTTERQPSPREA